MSGLTPDGDSNDLAILLESSNDPLAELEGQPPGDPPPPASVSVSSVCVVQDDNTNKGAILASVDGDSAPEVSAPAPSFAAAAQAPTPAELLEQNPDGW